MNRRARSPGRTALIADRCGMGTRATAMPDPPTPLAEDIRLRWWTAAYVTGERPTIRHLSSQRGRPSFRAATDFAIRRWRVSSVFAPSIERTCHDRLLYDSASNVRRAAGSASRAAAKSAGTVTSRGAVSSSRSMSMLVAALHAGAGPVLRADPDPRLAAHDGDAVAVRVAVDRDEDLRPAPGSERGHDPRPGRGTRSRSCRSGRGSCGNAWSVLRVRWCSRRRESRRRVVSRRRGCRSCPDARRTEEVSGRGPHVGCHAASWIEAPDVRRRRPR